MLWLFNYLDRLVFVCQLNIEVGIDSRFRGRSSFLFLFLWFVDIVQFAFFLRSGGLDHHNLFVGNGGNSRECDSREFNRQLIIDTNKMKYGIADIKISLNTHHGNPLTTGGRFDKENIPLSLRDGWNSAVRGVTNEIALNMSKVHAQSAIGSFTPSIDFHNSWGLRMFSPKRPWIVVVAFWNYRLLWRNLFQHPLETL